MAEWDYTGKKKLVWPGFILRNMFWDGTNWWVVGDLKPPSVCKFDYNWNHIKCYRVEVSPTSIFHDGTNWWMLGGDTVYKYDSNWNYTGVNHPVGHPLWPWTVDFFWDGTNWWVLDMHDDSVYKYDSNWTYIENYYLGNQDDDPHFGSRPISIFWDGTNWWMAGLSTNTIYKYDSNWNYTGINYYVGDQGNLSGIFHDGISWWKFGGPIYPTGTTVYKYAGQTIPATLTIDTTPVKGEVFVDDMSWGIAPQTREIKAGINIKHIISFGKVEGYPTPKPIEITLLDGEVREIIGKYAEEKKFPWILLGIPLLIIPFIKKKKKKKFK